MFNLHHFNFSIALGKPYVNIWRFQRYVEMQQNPKYGKRKVTRLSFGCFRVEYSTYLFTL